MIDIKQWKWKYIIPSVIIIVAIIFNIILLASYEFRGSKYYSVDASPDNKIENSIIFYDNTFTHSQQGSNINTGFYYEVPKGTSSNVDKNYITIEYNRTYSKENIFTVYNVFAIREGRSDNGELYICSAAVFLQILYGLLIIGAIAAIIVIHKKSNK